MSVSEKLLILVSDVRHASEREADIARDSERAFGSSVSRITYVKVLRSPEGTKGLQDALRILLWYEGSEIQPSDIQDASEQIRQMRGWRKGFTHAISSEGFLILLTGSPLYGVSHSDGSASNGFKSNNGSESSDRSDGYSSEACQISDHLLPVSDQTQTMRRETETTEEICTNLIRQMANISEFTSDIDVLEFRRPWHRRMRPTKKDQIPHDWHLKRDSAGCAGVLIVTHVGSEMHFLLQKRKEDRNEPSHWNIPSGKSEPHDSNFLCTGLREFWEEAGGGNDPWNRHNSVVCLGTRFGMVRRVDLPGYSDYHLLVVYVPFDEARRADLREARQNGEVDTSYVSPKNSEHMIVGRGYEWVSVTDLRRLEGQLEEAWKTTNPLFQEDPNVARFKSRAHDNWKNFRIGSETFLMGPPTDPFDPVRSLETSNIIINILEEGLLKSWNTV